MALIDHSVQYAYY